MLFLLGSFISREVEWPAKVVIFYEKEKAVKGRFLGPIKILYTFFVEGRWCFVEWRGWNWGGLQKKEFLMKQENVL